MAIYSCELVPKVVTAVRFFKLRFGNGSFAVDANIHGVC